MEASDHMKNIQFEQDTAPRYIPGGPAAAQAAAEEKEVEFDIGTNLDIGTAEEDFSRELVDQMDQPLPKEPGQQPKRPDDPNTPGFNEETGDYPPPTEPEEEEDVIEILEPKSETKRWLIGPEDARMELYQRPISFIGKMQWFALVGEMLDKAMSGPNPLSLADLIDNPTAQAVQSGRAAQAVQMKNLRDADTFVRALGKVVAHAPTFLIDSFVIWLGVPSQDRALVREILEMPEEQGGLSDDMAIEMIEIFIDQNWDALTRFFDRLGTVQKRIQSQQETRRRKA